MEWHQSGPSRFFWRLDRGVSAYHFAGLVGGQPFRFYNRLFEYWAAWCPANYWWINNCHNLEFWFSITTFVARELRTYGSWAGRLPNSTPVNSPLCLLATLTLVNSPHIVALGKFAKFANLPTHHIHWFFRHIHWLFRHIHWLIHSQLFSVLPSLHSEVSVAFCQITLV